MARETPVFAREREKEGEGGLVLFSIQHSLPLRNGIYDARDAEYTKRANSPPRRVNRDKISHRIPLRRIYIAVKKKFRLIKQGT